MLNKAHPVTLNQNFRDSLKDRHRAPQMYPFTAKKSINAFKMKSVAVSVILVQWSTIAYPDSLNCPCKVVNVTDGDIIHVLDQVKVSHKVRLAGIDAPEKKQVYGNKSKHSLTRRVAGQNVEVEFNKRDQYGRIIGKVLLQGQDVNLAQVIEGHAWHYKRGQRDQSRFDQALYSAAETEARSRRVGLWSMPRPVAPWDFRRANRK